MRLSFSDQRKTPERPLNGSTPSALAAMKAPAFTPFRSEDDPEQTAYLNLKAHIHRTLIQKMNLASCERMPVDQLRPEIDKLVSEILAQESLPLNSAEKVKLIDDLIDELRGFGPLEPLLRDPTVSDILANTYREVYVERRGVIELTNVRFADNDHLLRVIERIVDRVGRRVDESQPMVDARLPDGSRVNAVVPPVAVDGPMLSIRRFGRDALTDRDMVKN